MIQFLRKFDDEIWSIIPSSLPIIYGSIHSNKALESLKGYETFKSSFHPYEPYPQLYHSIKMAQIVGVLCTATIEKDGFHHHNVYVLQQGARIFTWKIDAHGCVPILKCRSAFAW